MVLAAAGLLGLAAASGPAFVASVGSAVLDEELGGADATPAVLRVRAAGQGAVVDELTEADERFGDGADARGLPQPELGLVAELETVAGERIVAIGQEDGTERLPDVVEPATGDLAMTAASAARLGVEAGGELVIADGDAEHEVTVGPIVEAFERGEVPAAWSRVSGLLLPSPDPRDPPPPPALLGDLDDVVALLDALQRSDATHAAAPTVTATWTVPVPRPVSLEEAEALEAGAQELTGAVAAGRGQLGTAVSEFATSPPQTGGDLSSMLDRARAAVTALEAPVRVLTVAASLLGLVAVGVGTVLAGVHHLDRARLWAVRGVSPPSLGARVAGLAVLPVVVGLAIGGGLGVVLVQGWLDAVVGPGRLREIGLALALLGMLAIVTVGVVVAAVAALRARDRPRRAAPPLLELLLVLVAGLAYQRLSDRGGGVVVDAGGVVDLDLLAVGAPLLLVLAGAAVGARLLGLVLRAAARLPARRPLAYLVSRRLRSVDGTGLLLTSVVTAALGLLVFATTLAASSEATVEAKARTVLGAGAVMELPQTESGREELDPARIEEPSTRVRWIDESRLDGSREVRLLAVDPETFVQIAHVPIGVDPQRFEALVTALEHDGEAERIPALLVGTSATAGSTVEADELELALEPVGRLPRFPGADEEIPLVVIADAGALDTGDAALDARLATRIEPELWIDSDRPAPELRGELLGRDPSSERDEPWGAASYTTTGVEELAEDPALATVAATFTFLRAQAAVLAGVTVLLLCLHHVARRREQALAEVLVARMGAATRLRRLVDLVQLGTLLLLAAVVATAVGMGTAGLALPDYDPMPAISLPVAFVAPVGLLVGVAAVLTGAVVATVWIAGQVVARAEVPQLLRGER